MKNLRFFYVFASLVVVSMNGGWGADWDLEEGIRASKELWEEEQQKKADLDKVAMASNPPLSKEDEDLFRDADDEIRAEIVRYNTRNGFCRKNKRINDLFPGWNEDTYVNQPQRPTKQTVSKARPWPLQCSLPAVPALNEEIQKARGMLKNLSSQPCDESNTIMQFQIIANLMDSYNKVPNQILAPHQCEYLVEQNARDDNDMSSYRIENFKNSPLLLGLVVKYDAQVALLRRDRMRHLNLSKAIHDVWVAGTYGLKDVLLGAENAKYLKGTDYEAACVMEFAFRNICPKDNGRFWVVHAEAFGLTSPIDNGLSNCYIKKWLKMCHSARYINSLNFQTVEYGAYFNKKDNFQKQDFKKSLEEFFKIGDIDKSQRTDYDMINYMHGSFQTYLKTLEPIMETNKDPYTIYDFGQEDSTSKNTCGFNSLFFEDVIAGNVQKIKKDSPDDDYIQAALRKAGCALLNHLCGNGSVVGLKKENIDGKKLYNKNEAKKTEYLSDADERLEAGYPYRDFLLGGPCPLELIAYAGNSNCIVLQNRDYLKETDKAINIFSPLLPIKFIHHDGQAHFRRAIFGTQPIEGLTKRSTENEDNPNNFPIKYMNALGKGSTSPWYDEIMKNILLEEDHIDN